MLLNLATNMYYVGQALDFKVRWKGHIYLLNNNVHTNIHLQNAWNKYGQIAFKFYILEIIIDENKLDEREQYWMDRSQCYDRRIGYNIGRIAESSMRGRKHSEETKLKISQILLGHPPSKAHTGCKHSDEAKLKISKANIGKKCSKETKIKMSIFQRSKIVSEKGRKNMSNSKMGNQSSRKLNKWPCADGWKCKCENCTNKRRSYWKEYDVKRGRSKI